MELMAFTAAVTELMSVSVNMALRLGMAALAVGPICPKA